MMTKKNIYLSEIDKFMLFLDNLSNDDILKLNNGGCKIRYELISDKSDGVEKTVNTKVLNINPQEIISELENMSSREMGEQYLLNKQFSRIDYETIIKQLDIPFQKRDNIEKLKDKIIEGTIGFRLRSQAIQEN